MTRTYTPDDLFWDIESLDKLFTVANFYPHSNSVVLSLLIDDDTLRQQLKQNEHRLKQAIVSQLPEGNFQVQNIHLEYLDEVGDRYSHPENDRTDYGLLSFVKRFGYTQGAPDKTNYQDEIEKTDQYQPNIKQDIYDQGFIRNGRKHPQWYLNQNPHMHHPRDVVKPEVYAEELIQRGPVDNWHNIPSPLRKPEDTVLPNGNQKKDTIKSFSEIVAKEGHQELMKYEGATDVKPIASGYYYPVKDTDEEFDPNRHGLRLGYNSTNYDMTMLSAFINGIEGVEDVLSYQTPETLHTYERVADEKPAIPTGQAMRNYNNDLFSDSFIRQMTSRLAHPSFYNDKLDGFGDYKSNRWLLHKAWQATNRYVDVSALNETMSRVGMKRLLGYLGRRIKEFEGLSDGSAIQDLDTLIDLLVYNVADVINLKWIFEHPKYQETYKLRQTLLKEYPMTVYEPHWNEKTNQYEAFIHEANIRKSRLTTNSTSAKFVENIISPNSSITDIETVSFMYPSKQEAKRLGIERFNVLDMCKDFFDETFNGTPAEGRFNDVYNFYKAIEGQNFNDTPHYKKVYGKNKPVQPRSLITELMTDGKHVEAPKNSTKYRVKKPNAYADPKYGNYNNQFGQGTCLLYYHQDGSPSRYYLKFSVGGTHGAEYNKDLYEKDVQAFQDEMNKLLSIQNKYKAQIMQTLQDINQSLQRLPNDVGYNDDKGPQKPLDPYNIHDLATAAVNNPDLTHIEYNGETYKIRDFMKSNSTREEAHWKLPKEPYLWKYENNRIDLNSKYKWTTQLFATDGDDSTNIFEDDFTSYYPLMLTRMSVYSKEQTKTNSNPETLEDIYLELFNQRKEYKIKAGDPSLPEEERTRYDLIQTAIKLLLNSATGVSNAVFENNVRADNSILSMRIIGQLFAWYVGQKQLLQGGKVASTNTDGLYIAGQPLAVNQQVLDETGEKIHVEIEPEEYGVFVSKDSNNRVKVTKNGKISPKGGTLGAFSGPDVTSNLDHPAIIDRLLTKYLIDPNHPNSANEAFDKERAKRILTEDMNSMFQEDPVEVLKMFQWIVSSSPGTHQFITQINYNKKTNKALDFAHIDVEPLPRYNRIFLTKTPDNGDIQTLMNVTHRKAKDKLTQATDEWRKADWVLAQHGIVCADTKEAAKPTNQNRRAYNNRLHETYDIAKFMKVRNMPKHQNLRIINDDLYLFVAMTSKEDIFQFMKQIDLDAYVSITEKTFKNSWQNKKA